MNIPKLVIAGTNSGVGKTTIATGLMSAYSRLGIDVQPFKVGPDYIDPTYHTSATGNKSINLDTVLMDKDTVVETFINNSKGKDLAIIEGVMGLFDGRFGADDTGSTAQIAKLLQAPVVLVLDVKAMARSAAAIAFGFSQFDKNLDLLGVILNNVGSERHFDLVKEALGTVDIPVLGCIYRNENFKLPERHLGLVPQVGEQFKVQKKEKLNLISKTVENSMDLLGLKKVAEKRSGELNSKNCRPIQKAKQVKIAVALDEAFHFYYWDGISKLADMGAEITYFSPLRGEKLPDGVEGLIIGGGFPELFLPQLASNQKMKDSIKKAYEQEMPIYAECGGYLYLMHGIEDFESNFFEMVGIIPCSAEMKNKLCAMGYRQGQTLESTIIGQVGTTVVGHEFHYSQLKNVPQAYPWAYELKNIRTGKVSREGYARKKLLASYMHLHWSNSIPWAENFVNNCLQYSERIR
ncbi:cobyrinic acid a,c-diamide synthase [Desulfitispora alkaliphila]|uniref:cobyrinate a,c-diamide synthase n=1 Tax=Desulfitispora alkaliphila TaxID=622674 RepID=UPI003D19C35B